MSLIAGSAPWMGSVSFSVQIPETMNRLVDMRAAAVAPPSLTQDRIIGQAGRPGFVLPGDTPRTLQKKLPFPATELGVIWRGESDPPRVRTSSDGRSWTAWRQAEENADMLDDKTGTHYSDLLPGQRALFAQVKPADIAQAASVKLAVINTADGRLRKVKRTRTASAAAGQPEVISRGSWGADESIRGGDGRFTRAKSIFVHHTNTPNNDGDPAGTLRAIYSYHVKNRGFHDIGYNFLIDQRGRIYEGRYSGPPRSRGAQWGEDSNGFSVLGAHTKDHNAGSIGIAMLGNADAAAPAGRAIESLVQLSAWAADRHGINPLGTFKHVNPSTGEAETMPNIAGHKDSGSSITHCPGTILHTKLPSLRNRIEEIIATSAPASPPSMPTATALAHPSPSESMTPNATGDVSRAAVQVDLLFQRADGGPTRTVSVEPRAGSFHVTDASYRGRPLEPGVYSVRALAFDSQGRSSPVAPVAEAYELRPASALPALGALVAPVLNPPLGSATGGVLADTAATVIRLLAL